VYDAGVAPITKETKSRIYAMLATLGIEVDDKCAQRIAIIKNFTEEEAKAYLEILESQRDHAFSHHLAAVTVQHGMRAFLPPDDIYTPELASLDTNLVKQLAMMYGSLSYSLGSLKGLFMAALYAMASWGTNWSDPIVRRNYEVMINEEHRRRYGKPKYDDPTTGADKHHAKSSVSSHGGEPQPNGKNYSND
jgi:hypothetical protein